MILIENILDFCLYPVQDGKSITQQTLFPTMTVSLERIGRLQYLSKKLKDLLLAFPAFDTCKP